MKKILIITQKIDRDDSILGFFHRWVEEFSTQCEKVTVICLSKGSYDFNKNVQVLSLGKEKKISRFWYTYNFYLYIWKFRREYDVVFVHMNQIYVILGGVLWRMLNKKVALWYAHGYASYSLRLAEWCSNIIFTSTKSGFRLSSKKIKIVGQGIDTHFFKPNPTIYENHSCLNIITVGRISPVKNYEPIIAALAEVVSRGVDAHLYIIGDAQIDSQKTYLTQLQKLVLDSALLDRVYFMGAVPQHVLPEKLSQASLFINASKTGSLDKSGLEAMAMGLPIFTNNEAYREILGKDAERYMFEVGDASALALKIENFSTLSLEERTHIGNQMRDIVLQSYDISGLIERILRAYDSNI